jgi:hypothetical protein
MTFAQKQKYVSCTVEYENGDKKDYYFNGKLVTIFGTDYKSTLTLYPDLSSDKIKVKVADIKEITFTDGEDGTAVVFYAKGYMGNALGKANKNLSSEKTPFMVLYRDDDITVAKQRITVWSQGTSTTYDYYYYLKAGEIHPKFVLLESVGGTIGWETLWKNSLSKYFSDCPQLVARIKKGEFNVKYKNFGVENLVEVYKAYLSYKKR